MTAQGGGRRFSYFEFIGYDESLDGVPQQRWLKAAVGARAIVLRTNDIDSQ